MFTIRRLPLIANNLLIRQINSTKVCNTFWERDEKGGYGKVNKIPTLQMIRDGLKELKKEVALWTQEVKEHFDADPILVYRPGETDVVWKFDTSESLQNWVATSDSDHNEGYSKCKLELSQTHKGVFSGTLSSKVPKDGRIQRAGYCNIRSMRARVSNDKMRYKNF